MNRPRNATVPRWLRAVVGVALVVALCACSGSVTAPPDATTGADAAPVGRVFDMDVTLPHVVFGTGEATGVELDVTLDVETAGPGEHVARITHNGARVTGASEPVLNLGASTTTLTEAGSRWFTARIGPIRVRDVTFEYFVSGESSAGGYFASGEANESQTALGGSFLASRRQRFLVATSDFSIAGQIDLVEVVRDSQIRVTARVANASADPVVRVTGGGAFVVNRLGFDNVTRLDPRDGFKAAWQASIGAGANPHDVALVDDEKAYVSRYEPPFDDLAIIAAKGGAGRGTIELSSFAENRDATPRADRLAQAGGLVFAGLQDIDRTFTRYAGGKLAAIDPTSDAVVGVVALPGKNPGTIDVVREASGETLLYVALGGIFPGLLPQELSGGVAVVDPVDLAFVRLALDDDDAGGNIGALAIARPTLGYVVVSDANYLNRVVAFDPSQGLVLRDMLTTTEFLPELEVSRGGLLAIPDRSFAAPRVCLHRIPSTAASGAAAIETLLGCVPLTRPPTSLEALD